MAVTVTVSAAVAPAALAVSVASPGFMPISCHWASGSLQATANMLSSLLA